MVTKTKISEYKIPLFGCGLFFRVGELGLTTVLSFTLGFLYVFPYVVSVKSKMFKSFLFESNNYIYHKYL